jgi:hypothetical protein
MLDLNPLFEFSRAHCVAICAFLVPANLISTVTTLTFTAWGRSFRQILLTAGIAALFSGIMVLHVLTWFLIGVVMIPTYVLLMLGSVCLVINLWAVFRPTQLAGLLQAIVKICTKVDVPALLNSHD